MARKSGSDELFRLIRSLTPEEKGYFKKFSTRHSAEGNTYLKMFNDIEKQKVFEEETLKKRYKNYAVKKVYLFESIMESLMVYQKDNDGKFNPHYSVIYFHILFRKNLLEKAEQLNKKTLETARAVEWFSMEIQFLEFNLVLGMRKWKIEDWIEKYSATFAEINEIRRKEVNRDKHNYINGALYHIQLRQMNDKSYDVDPDDMIDAPFLKDKKNSLSTTSDRMRLLSLTRYYMIKKDYKAVCRTFGELYALESSFVGNRLRTNKQYLSAALRGLLDAYLRISEINKAKVLFEKEWTIDENDEHTYYNTIAGNKFDTFENYIYYCQHHSRICWYSGEYKRGLELIRSEENKINNPTLRYNHVISFYDTWQCKILFEFNLDKTREAMMSISELESMNIKKEAPIVFQNCQWMKVLIQLKLKNYNIVQNLCANLLKSKEGYQFSEAEKAFLFKLKKVEKGNIKDIKETMSKLSPIKIFDMMDMDQALKNV